MDQLTNYTIQISLGAPRSSNPTLAVQAPIRVGGAEHVHMSRLAKAPRAQKLVGREVDHCRHMAVVSAVHDCHMRGFWAGCPSNPKGQVVALRA